MNQETNVNDVVAFYMSARNTASVSNAATQTIERFPITPALLVDAFNAAHLDFSRSEAEAETIRAHRNELLSHFNNQSSADPA